MSLPVTGSTPPTEISQILTLPENDVVMNIQPTGIVQTTAQALTSAAGQMQTLTETLVFRRDELSHLPNAPSPERFALQQQVIDLSQKLELAEQQMVMESHRFRAGFAQVKAEWNQTALQHEDASRAICAAEVAAEASQMQSNFEAQQAVAIQQVHQQLATQARAEVQLVQQQAAEQTHQYGVNAQEMLLHANAQYEAHLASEAAVYTKQLSDLESQAQASVMHAQGTMMQSEAETQNLKYEFSRAEAQLRTEIAALNDERLHFHSEVQAQALQVHGLATTSQSTSDRLQISNEEINALRRDIRIRDEQATADAEKRQSDLTRAEEREHRMLTEIQSMATAISQMQVDPSRKASDQPQPTRPAEGNLSQAPVAKPEPLPVQQVSQEPIFQATSGAGGDPTQSAQASFSPMRVSPRIRPQQSPRASPRRVESVAPTTTTAAASNAGGNPTQPSTNAGGNPTQSGGSGQPTEWHNIGTDAENGKKDKKHKKPKKHRKKSPDDSGDDGDDDDGGDSDSSSTSSRSSRSHHGRRKKHKRPPYKCAQCIFPDFPGATEFKQWKSDVFDVVVHAVKKDPIIIRRWLAEVDTIKNMEDLGDQPQYDRISAEMTFGLFKIIKGNFKRNCTLLKEKYEKVGKVLSGRQLLWTIVDYFKSSAVEKQMFNMWDLSQVHLHNDDLVRLKTDWDSCLDNINKRPDDEELESMFSHQLSLSLKLADLYAIYTRDVLMGNREKSYTYLYDLLKKFLEHARMEQVRNAHLRSRSGGKGIPPLLLGTQTESPPKGGRCCFEWARTGKCRKGNACPYSMYHTPELAGSQAGKAGGKGKKGKKGKGKGKGKKGKGGNDGWSSNRSSNGGSRADSPARGGSSSGTPGTPRNNRRNYRGTAPNGQKNRPICNDYMKGACTRGSACSYTHPATCKFFRNGTCTMGDQCAFRHLNKSKDGKAFSAASTPVDTPRQGANPNSPRSTTSSETNRRRNKRRDERTAAAKAKAKAEPKSGFHR